MGILTKYHGILIFQDFQISKSIIGKKERKKKDRKKEIIKKERRIFRNYISTQNLIFSIKISSNFQVRKNHLKLTPESMLSEEIYN